MAWWGTRVLLSDEHESPGSKRFHFCWKEQSQWDLPSLCACVFICRFIMNGRWILRSLFCNFLTSWSWLSGFSYVLTVTKCKLNLIRGLLAAVKFWYRGNFVMVEVVSLCLIVIWWVFFLQMVYYQISISCYVQVLSFWIDQFNFRLNILLAGCFFSYHLHHTVILRRMIRFWNSTAGHDLFVCQK